MQRLSGQHDSDEEFQVVDSPSAKRTRSDPAANTPASKKLRQSARLAQGGPQRDPASASSLTPGGPQQQQEASAVVPATENEDDDDVVIVTVVEAAQAPDVQVLEPTPRQKKREQLAREKGKGRLLEPKPEPADMAAGDEREFDRLWGMTEKELDQLAAGAGAGSSGQHTHQMELVARFRAYRQQLLAAHQQLEEQQALSQAAAAAAAAEEQQQQPDGLDEAGALEDMVIQESDQPEEEEQQQQRSLQQQNRRRKPQQQQHYEDLEQADGQQQQHIQQQQPDQAAAAPAARRRSSAAQQQQQPLQLPPLQPPPLQQQTRQRQQQAPSPHQQQQQQRQRQQRPGPAPAAAAAAGGGPGDAAASLSADQRRRRKLRQELNRVEASVLAQQQELVDANSGRLLNFLAQNEQLGSGADRPREAARHTGVVLTLARLGHTMVINHLSHASGRRPVDLVNALRRQYAPDPLLASRVDFAAIGAAATAAGAWRGAPGVQTMLGPMQAAAKVRRVAQRRPREAVAAEVKPVENPEANASETQETDHWVQTMREAMARDGQRLVPFVRLVVNHRSFSQTVENIFALSFLVKDLWCSLEQDEQRGLLVRYLALREREARLTQHRATEAAGGARSAADGRLTPHQFMFEINMALWRDMCRAVPPGQGLMPHRELVAVGERAAAAAAAAAGQQQRGAGR